MFSAVSASLCSLTFDYNAADILQYSSEYSNVISRSWLASKSWLQQLALPSMWYNDTHVMICLCMRSLVTIKYIIHIICTLPDENVDIAKPLKWSFTMFSTKFYGMTDIRFMTNMSSKLVLPVRHSILAKELLCPVSIQCVFFLAWKLLKLVPVFLNLCCKLQ